MSFDIISASHHITDKYLRYLKTMFDIDEPTYKKLFDAKMTELGSFAKGPYLDVVDSFEAGSSVPKLIEEGVLSPDFRYVSDIYQKTLYKHQESSIRKLNDGKNVVVSTGTGSGKTESFLIPILNTLMEEKRSKGKITPGVRALLIYPMNALANDQISRLRSLLKDYPYITFGSYTGQTLEKEEKALNKYKSLNHGAKPLKNELISREKMKDTPPNILITNYSMLEYLMLRPKDNSLFQGENSKEWKYIVLDEAHTYSGSTGIEVSMLLRRLKAYLTDCDIRFILTSATLGGEKSNAEVAQFASSLCDAPFSPEDVIRASRIKLYQSESDTLSLTNEDYYELNQILEAGYSDEKTLKLLSSYLNVKPETENVSEYLFDTLLKYNTFWRIKRLLSKPKTVAEICKAIEWDESAVSNFVNVASAASKNRKKLFDARYHMFIRATEGVFVTLGKHKDLSLTRQTKKIVDDTEYRYFEIVTCSQCHAVYLLGIIQEIDGKEYLRQKSNLGGENIHEAFLIGDTVNDDDDDNTLDDENLKVKFYELCPHCGFIREKNQVHKVKCDHSESDYINLTKVIQTKRTGRVTKCIKCEGTNNLGVLRSFFAGQEASTSVVGTALFEELPNKEVVHITGNAKELIADDGFDDDFEDVAEAPKTFAAKAKQFIAFSDNRQAAAFFATYFYGTYQGFLYSRIVYENIKRISESGKPMVNFVNEMSTTFRDYHVSEMGDGNPDYVKEAWKAMMKELIQSYSRNSLIGLGLMKIDLDDSIRIPAHKKYGFTEEEDRDICLVWLRSLFEDNAIYHGQNFSDADIAFYSNNGARSTYVFSNPPTKYIKSFIPKSDSTTNKRFDYLNRVFKAKGIVCEHEDLTKFMSGLWSRMEKSNLFHTASDYQGYQADIKQLKVVNTTKWYRCTKCHRITPYNVAGVCTAYKCDGKLEPVNVAELEKENHYYQIYHDLSIQPLRVREHTAQLSSEEAYRLQDLFKAQKIDVLSCSTTFEMGVDIGDLETVFMRNMPPTPSNYVQRAGRAGRSTKSAALALTFCNKSNHDFSFFNNPVSMINGEIQPPLFKVENEKIGIRHLYSAALAFFWRIKPDYFGPVGNFFGEETVGDGYEELKKYLESQPEDLKQYLLKAFPPSLLDKLEIPTFGWTRWLFDEPDPSYPNLKNVYEQYRNEVDSLFKEKEKLEADNRNNYAVVTRINTYIKENIISFLSRANILPKYGFPVDTVELQIDAGKNARVLPIELSRDLAMAISEYAPGCEIIANGNLITSRYIKKMPNRNWRQYDFVQCPTCKTLNIAMHHDVKDDIELKSCNYCDHKFLRNDIGTFLIPEFGFASETKIEKPSLIKPERTYRSEASMVTEGKQTYSGKYSFGNLSVQVTALEEGEIAMLNKSDFFVCPTCGYTLGDFEANEYSHSHERSHKNRSGYDCKNRKLTKYSLGYRFKTDALHLRINEIFSFEEAYSVLQAVILSACRILNLDNNEVSGCLQYAVNGTGNSYDFIIYDTTPGGAGHVRRFADRDTMEKVLHGAYDKAFKCDCGGEEGDTSCYKCLRTYQNQQHHDTIKRKYVIDKLKGLFVETESTDSDTSLKKVEKTMEKQREPMKFNFAFCNTSISTEKFEYIVETLNLEDDDLEDRITNALVEANVPTPDYADIDFKVPEYEDGYANLMWKDQKVLVFAPENEESYKAALNRGYQCFLINANIELPALIDALR